MIRIQLASLLILASPLLQAQSITIPNEAYIELQKFEAGGQKLSENFVRDFPQRVYDEILQTELGFLKSLNGVCKDSIKITFGSKLLGHKEAAETAFEKGVIRVEASKCFQNANPTDLIEISAETGFKRKAFSTLKNITSQVTAQGVLDCEWTSAPTIGKSHYCYLNFDLEKTPELHSQVNFLTFSENEPSIEAPVYFREALITARRMGPQTLYYVQSYVRATAISSLKKFFVEQYIQSSQNQVFTELEKSLQKKRPGQ